MTEAPNSDRLVVHVVRRITALAIDIVLIFVMVGLLAFLVGYQPIYVEGRQPQRLVEIATATLVG